MLHQNRLTGKVPQSLADLGCIVNLAGNAHLDLGGDVPAEERAVLVELFHCTNGRWVSMCLYMCLSAMYLSVYVSLTPH